MPKGKILLRRKTSNFLVGFCIIRKEFPELEKQLFLLHPDEKKYYASLKFEKRKISYLLGRIAAKTAILELDSIKSTMQSFAINSGVFQFPVVKYIQYQNIQVSISHCDFFGVALAFPEEHPLGIDIEEIKEDRVDVMKTIICEKELDLMNNNLLSLAVGSTMVWTIKESLSKVLKTGLTLDFKFLEIESIEKVGVSYISTFKHFMQYKAISYKIGNYICSIVQPKKTFAEWDHFNNVLISCIMKNKNDDTIKNFI